MSEALTIFLVFMGIIIVTAVVFAVWLLLALMKLVFRGVFGLFGVGSRDAGVIGPTYCCPRRGCHAVNPSSARFCRRCGRELLRGEMVRRAAMW